MPLFAVGVLSIAAQVVLLRELTAAFFGIELVYILALATWLMGTAAGALGARWRRPAPALVGGAFALTGLVLVLDVVFLRRAHVLMGGVPGAFLPFWTQVSVMTMTVLPPAAILGALFPWFATWTRGHGWSAARSYGVEGAGAVAGGLVVTALLKTGASSLGLSIVTAATAIGVAMDEWRMPDPRAPSGDARGPRMRGVGIGVVVGLGLMTFVDRATTWDLQLVQWSQPATVDVVDIACGRVTVARVLDQIAVFENGALAFESESASPEAFAALAAAQVVAPGAALVLGGGPEGVARELRVRAMGAITVIEHDERAYNRVMR